MNKFFFLLFLLSLFGAQAQERHTLSGYVKDSLSGESMIGASVSVVGQTRSLQTNAYGFFSITLPKGQYQVQASFTGYQPLILNVNLDSNRTADFALLPRNMMQEVVVTSKRRDGNVMNARMGSFDLSASRLKSVPAIFGEVDLMKTLQLLPGVRNAGEGNTGLYVRGGGPDQNLILLDDAVVYNTGHLFGFFSIFNSDVIKNTTLIKGGMPAQYGGRLSSVLDVAMKEGNMKKFETEGGIGLIASRFAVQGPLNKDKASFMVAARRTYVDMLVKPFIPSTSAFSGSGYYFYDLNTKINYRFSDKNRLYLSGYFGRDVFNFNNKNQSFKTKIPWGNATATMRWNHVFNKKLFSNTTLVYNDYFFTFAGKQNDITMELNSGIRDLSSKLDFDYYPKPNHQLKFGMLLTHHRFTPNVVSGGQGTTVFKPSNSGIKYALESGVYIQHDWDLTEKFRIGSGLRYSSFTQMGPYMLYKTDANFNYIDSTYFGPGKTIQTYGGFEPRFTLRYTVGNASSIKASVMRNRQYIHLVSNAASTLPTDLWVPSTYLVKPQLGWLYAAGYFQNFNDNLWETSVELYYKKMENQIEYREGYTQSLNDPEVDFVFGKGWSYGTEFYINKSRGRFTGWLGYTLSWTWRKFEKLNAGVAYPAKYDRRHDLSLVGMYELNKRWKLSSVFVYGTGNATTLPERFYIVNGVLTQEYSRINQYRLAPYHRLDFSATYDPLPKKQRKYKYQWVFSVYNVYNRMNPYFLYFSQEGSPFNGTLQVEARQVSLFPVLPSITLNFKPVQ